MYVNLTRRFKTTITNWRGKKVRNRLSEDRKTVKLVCAGPEIEEKFDWIEQIKIAVGLPRGCLTNFGPTMAKASLTVQLEITDALRYGDQLMAVVNFCYDHYLGLEFTGGDSSSRAHVTSYLRSLFVARHMPPDTAKFLLESMFDLSGRVCVRRRVDTKHAK